MTLSPELVTLNGLIRSQSLSTSLMPWSNCTRKKHTTHQHRPNRKRKVRRGRNLTLMIYSVLVQSYKNIPIHYQSTVMYFTMLSVVRLLQNEVKASDAALIGEKMANSFRNSFVRIPCQDIQWGSLNEASKLVTRQRLTWRQSFFICLWLDKSDSCS